MDINVLDIKGQETGRKVTLSESIFGIEPNDHVIYLDVKQYMADQRQGTHKSKERSEVSGSTRKLGRQKGWCSPWRHQLTGPRRWWSCLWTEAPRLSFQAQQKSKESCS